MPAIDDTSTPSTGSPRIARLYGHLDLRCKQCRLPFLPKTERKGGKLPEYCSQTCANKFTGKKAKKTRRCKRCGKDYLVASAPGKSRAYCSQDCRDKTSSCEYCGLAYTPRMPNQKYCGKDCRTKAENPPLSLTAPMLELECSECGKRYQANTHLGRRFCSPQCMRRPDRRRRRAMERAAFVEDVPMSYLIERDDATCQLCLKAVDLEATVPDPMAPTIDHVTPLSKGGLHTRFNTQLAHFSCNTKKGANT